MGAEPVVFTCSPRKGGNSDSAADVIVRALAELGHAPRLVRLRDTPLRPCLGCYGCRKDVAGRCVLADADQARQLYDLLMHAPQFYFTAPIFFYHLPGLFKDFIDRSQPYYLRRENNDPSMLGLAPRKACAVLLAGRRHGERLFDGSLLTLKFFLRTFNIRLEESLNLRGIDLPGDLAGNDPACESIRDMVRRSAG